ncbi:MAG: sialate O-acetylesterase [Gemmataceae bacterium]
MRLFLVAFLAVATGVASVQAEVRLPSVFGSHMVLQRDRPIIIYGITAEPGTQVEVALDDDQASTTSDANGNWSVKLSPRKASTKGATLKVQAGGTVLKYTDILIGDVWVGSGQSNMEWPLTASADPKETIAQASHPMIRLYHVPKVQPPTPARDIDAFWRVCKPLSAQRFSAVLYHFGVKLQKELDVPIGLINSSWGGSRIEPWTVTPAPDAKVKGPGGMYNGMIAPLRQFSIKGVLWYQGESNMAEGMLYRERKERLINDWRTFWGAEMPFYFVQIAPYARYGKPVLPEFWEAQTACLKIPHTGMVVITDLVDDLNDIHPKNKREVGERLARWALNRSYGRADVVVSGPLFKSLKIDGDKAIVFFAYAKGLKSRDGKPLSEWEIAGEDGTFVQAEATIDGETVVVRGKGVSNPTQVRLGWRNVANPNLCNGEGLPAAPFRSKDWKGGTGEASGDATK